MPQEAPTVPAQAPSRPKLKAGGDQSPRLLRLDDGQMPETIPYELIRARRRSMVIQARAEGIRVRAPKCALVGEIETFMRRHAKWIREHLLACSHLKPFAWRDGTVLPVLGRAVRIAGIDGMRGIALVGDQLALPPALLESGCRDAVLAWLRSSALVLFQQRVTLHVGKMGISAPPLRLTNARTRWGSCAHGPNGTRLSLHWKLYHLPLSLIDYVIVHELAHLREMNHSARFWAEVECLYPDYKVARVELNRIAPTLPLI